MGAQLMEHARLFGVGKFVAIGTVCSYPKFTPVPFREDDLWNGYPEETNAPYGLAKKMLLVQSQAYRHQYGFNAIYLLPVNLYGPRDNFDPALLARDPGADQEVRGGGRGRRAAHRRCGARAAPRASSSTSTTRRDAIVLAAERYDGREPVNIGAGFEIAIARPGDAHRPPGRTFAGRSCGTPPSPMASPAACSTPRAPPPSASWPPRRSRTDFAAPSIGIAGLDPASQSDGGPRHGPPFPPTLGAPRPSRGAPRSPTLGAPRPSRGAPRSPTLGAPRPSRGAPRSPTLGAPRPSRGAPRSPSRSSCAGKPGAPLGESRGACGILERCAVQVLSACPP